MEIKIDDKIENMYLFLCVLLSIFIVRKRSTQILQNKNKNIL